MQSFRGEDELTGKVHQIIMEIKQSPVPNFISAYSSRED